MSSTSKGFHREILVSLVKSSLMCSHLNEGLNRLKIIVVLIPW